MIGTGTTRQQTYLRDHNNQDIYDDEGKERLFRSTWKDVFRITPEENENFDDITDTTVTEYLNRHRQKTIPHDFPDIRRLDQQTIPITTEEIRKTIATFKQRSPGEDGLTKYHLTHLPPNMLRTFLSILNASLTLGQYPAPWKTSIMVFIPKPGKSPLQHQNYRPISLLSVPGKTFEKLINRRLMTFLTINNLHLHNQHGFRPGLGTSTATALMYEHVAVGRANKLKLNIILRDISKAFDKVWHQGLVFKIMTNNFPDYLIRIIYSYLQDRNAKIRIGEFVGEAFSLDSGVPQGGCLSPTLFNFYTHDLPEADGQSINLVYADDITQIIGYRGSEKMTARITAREIERVNNFEYRWKIQTNQTKFQIIPIARTKLEVIRVGNIIHPYKTEGKALGLTITTNGFFKHIKQRIQLAKLRLRDLYRFRNLSLANKRKLYLALIRSTLTYPPVPLHTISTTQMRKLQIIQNKSARLITNIRYSDRMTNETVNDLADLEPINLFLHRQASNTWTTIDKTMTDRTRQRLTVIDDELRLFPSSRSLALGPEPLPIF
jgi:hypothetical protein